MFTLLCYVENYSPLSIEFGDSSNYEIRHFLHTLELKHCNSPKSLHTEKNIFNYHRISRAKTYD